MPEFYTLVRAESLRLHHSRVIRFEGAMLPPDMFKENTYWHDSVLSRLRDTISGYQTANRSVLQLMHDLGLDIYKLQDLASLVAQGDENIVRNRIESIQLQKSAFNAIVLDREDDYERKMTNFSGVSDILRSMGNRLVASTDIPHTKLLGESPSGLGATGDSEKNDWFDYVKNKQITMFEPILNKVIEILMLDKNGPTNGNILPFDIVFKPLFQHSTKEMLDMRKVQAEIDEKYIMQGVLDPNEVRDSRFAEGDFTHKYNIETEDRSNANDFDPNTES